MLSTPRLKTRAQCRTIAPVRPYLLLPLILVACDRTPEPTAEPPSKPTAEPVREPASRPAPPPAPKPLGITWSDPAGWERVESSSAMRKATYKVPHAKGDKEDAELAVFNFPGSGGGVDANVDRWVKQFEGVAPGDVKRSKETVNGLTVHRVEIPSGTFQSGMPGGPTEPKPKWGMLGAIVEAPGGNWFFKLTGPEKTVRAAAGGFSSLVQSVKSK